jgi:hypothetical protein
MLLCFHCRLRLLLVVVILHLCLVAIEEQPRRHPDSHHGRRCDAQLLVRGIIAVHLRLDRGLLHDDAIAQLAHGDLGGLLGHCLQRDHGRVIAHRAQGRDDSLHRHRLDRLPGRAGVHHGDVGGHRGGVLQHPDHGRLGHLAFAIEGGHLVLSMLPGQLHGLHLQLFHC